MGEKYSIVWHGTSIKHAEDKMYYDLLFVFWLLEGFLLVSQAVLKSSALAPLTLIILFVKMMKILNSLFPKNKIFVKENKKSF
jgi:1,2-phenylacetyl-CoA epoxidase catalytic subunit